mgnify:CR=1 FL=1
MVLVKVRMGCWATHPLRITGMGRIIPALEQAAQEVCTSKELDRGWVSVTGWDCLAKARMEAPRAAAHRDRRARCR